MAKVAPEMPQPELHQAQKSEVALPGVVELPSEGVPQAWQERSTTQADSECDTISPTMSRQISRKSSVKSFTLRRTLSNVVLSTTEPRLMDIYQWTTNELGLNAWHRVVICYFLDVLISTVLGLAGVLFAYMFANVNLDWQGESRHRIMIFIVMGSIFTGWNIAQYASFTIQTTGHQSIRGHFYALAKVGVFLVPSNLVGWAMCLFCALVIPKAHVIIHALICCGPSILVGILIKTVCKLKYFKDRSEEGFAITDRDALGQKVHDLSCMGVNTECPFSSLNLPVIFSKAAKPATCFLWTVVYAFGLRVALLLVFKLPGGKEGWQQVLGQTALFLLSILMFYLGNNLLKDAIAGEKGLMSYSNKMCVAFFFIYGMITNSLIRVSVVSATGPLRVAFGIVQPLFLLCMRIKTVKEFKGIFRELLEKYEKNNGEDGAYTTDFPAFQTKASRMVIAAVGSLFTTNVSVICFTGMSCIFGEHPEMDITLGSCANGLVKQVVYDLIPVWTLDLIELVILIRGLKMPVLYYFFMLDPFIVLATVIVVYVNLCLILLTGSVSF